MLNALILAVAGACGAVLALPRVSRSSMWRAMMTPLASIIGSGFLILGPLLNALYGGWALLAMALLCLVAYLFGAAIRANIADRNDGSPLAGAGKALDTASSWALAFAYFIAVAYYLNLFGAFAVDLTPWNNEVSARIVTSAVFGVILAVGCTRGFSALERMEQVSVGIKLSIIAGLLAGLVWYFAVRASDGALHFNPVGVGPQDAILLGFGLIVTVQGFETSRYLGAAYPAETRIRSMKLAQLVSTMIYLVYIGLISFVFHADSLEVDEAAIIDLMRVVAPILPGLLVAGALAAQFSAAVADTSGAGGLIVELTRRRVGPRIAYAVLVGMGLLLTWTSDVFEIISYASRAFALYYGLQSAVAAVSAWPQAGRRPEAVGYGLLALLGLAIAALGMPVE